MSDLDLTTYAENTWCEGCGDFGILSAINHAVKSLADDGLPVENVVLASGIGCHAKIVDYINLNSFYSLHGRVPPTITGIKLANRSLKVIGFAGDGDAYGEGLSHLIMSAKRNIDVTMIIHDNRVYGLTTGQFTPTSPVGFPGRSTPRGSIEEPFNPLDLMLASGATFVARGYTTKSEHLVDLIKRAIGHKGFAFIDVLQPCFTFFNTYEYYNKRVYELENHDPSDIEAARVRAREWQMGEAEKIPIGLFFQTEKPTFDEKILRDGMALAGSTAVPDIKGILESMV
jgi:2-oxoglutarate ferredoxin oxidoreductase subunit beta